MPSLKLQFCGVLVPFNPNALFTNATVKQVNQQSN